jgi:hypothetical protein
MKWRQQIKWIDEKSWFFEKINKIDKPFSQTIQNKDEEGPD